LLAVWSHCNGSRLDTPPASDPTESLEPVIALGLFHSRSITG
jgi:hypothetical protein